MILCAEQSRGEVLSEQTSQSVTSRRLRRHLTALLVDLFRCVPMPAQLLRSFELSRDWAAVVPDLTPGLPLTHWVEELLDVMEREGLPTDELLAGLSRKFAEQRQADAIHRFLQVREGKQVDPEVSRVEREVEHRTYRLLVDVFRSTDELRAFLDSQRDVVPKALMNAVFWGVGVDTAALEVASRLRRPQRLLGALRARLPHQKTRIEQAARAMGAPLPWMGTDVPGAYLRFQLRRAAPALGIGLAVFYLLLLATHQDLHLQLTHGDSHHRLDIQPGLSAPLPSARWDSKEHQTVECEWRGGLGIVRRLLPRPSGTSTSAANGLETCQLTVLGRIAARLLWKTVPSHPRAQPLDAEWEELLRGRIDGSIGTCRLDLPPHVLAENRYESRLCWLPTHSAVAPASACDQVAGAHCTRAGDTELVSELAPGTWTCAACLVATDRVERWSLTAEQPLKRLCRVDLRLPPHPSGDVSPTGAWQSLFAHGYWSRADEAPDVVVRATIDPHRGTRWTRRWNVTSALGTVHVDGYSDPLAERWQRSVLTYAQLVARQHTFLWADTRAKHPEPRPLQSDLDREHDAVQRAVRQACNRTVTSSHEESP